MSGHRVGIGRVAVEWSALESGHRVPELAPTIIRWSYDPVGAGFCAE